MQNGLRQAERLNGCLPDFDLNLTRASGSLRLDPRLAPPNEDQQAPLGPGVLHGDAHELLGQPGKDHLTRKCLRRFHDSLDVQLPNRRNRSRGCGSSFLAQARIALVELLYLTVGAPTVIAVARGA